MPKTSHCVEPAALLPRLPTAALRPSLGPQGLGLQAEQLVLGAVGGRMRWRSGLPWTALGALQQDWKLQREGGTRFPMALVAIAGCCAASQL